MSRLCISPKNPEIILIGEILDVVRTAGDESPAVGDAVPAVDAVIKQMEGAFHQSVENATLKSLILSTKKSGDR